MMDGSKANGAAGPAVGWSRHRVDGMASRFAGDGERRRLAPALKPGVPPPPDYYRNNLLRVLGHVLGTHADLLDGDTAGFIGKVMAASHPAQRLYSRLVSRKGPQIRRDKLSYPEVSNLAGAAEELVQAGLLAANADAPADSLMQLFTKDELSRLFNLRVPGKRALLASILECHTDQAIRARLRQLTDWLCVAGRQHLELVQLLFFGDSASGAMRADLTTLVLDDLGTARFEDYAVSREHRLFNDRAQLHHYLRARELNRLCKRADEQPGVAHAVLALLEAPRCMPSRLEQRLLDRARNRLGRWFERAGAADEALVSYAGASAHPARERQVRILARQGRESAARALLEEIRSRPRGPEEQDFAARFGRRRAATVLPVTNVPMRADWPGSIESQALHLLARAGGEGWHLENRLPLGLAGLAFWNVVFAPSEGAFVNPYQAAPLDLFWEDFAARRQQALAAARVELADPQRFAQILRRTLQAKAGVVNRLVSWRHIEARLLERILATVPHEVLFRLVCHVIVNLWRVRTGFPDLLVLYGEGDYEFVEVKGPSDQLQPAQRTWFKFFLENDCNARILKFKNAESGPER